MIEIKRWLDGRVLATIEADTLTDANFTRTDFTDADLTGENLTDANLTGANLTGADLTGFRDDIWEVLASAPAEASAVLGALKAGRVDGSTYAGDCCCLVGTIANAHGCGYDEIAGLTPNASRPAEVWFMQIRPGDTTSFAATQAMAWVEDWLTRMRAAFGATAP